MLRLNIALGLLLAVGLAIAGLWTLPRGLEAGRTLAARDDPAQLSDLALERGFDAAAAEREIRAALAGNDPELAQSFVELARERAVAVDPELVAKADADMQAWSSFGSTAWRFARGFFVGNPDDMASLTGTAAGDLLVIGDVRDAAREGWRMARGEEPNRLVLGLSLGGIAVTAGTFATFGLAAPARAGLSVIKVAGKSERIDARLLRFLRFERPAAVAESRARSARSRQRPAAVPRSKRCTSRRGRATLRPSAVWRSPRAARRVRSSNCSAAAPSRSPARLSISLWRSCGRPRTCSASA